VLHDIGTTKENLRATRLSFEFFGGMLALRVLQDVDDGERVEIGTGTGIGASGATANAAAAVTATDTTTATNANATAPREQAESVAEAVIRHQDLCHVGKITVVGQLLQLATIFGKCCTSSPFLLRFQFKPSQGLDDSLLFGGICISISV
jgi:cyanamide hydratase